MAQKNVSTRAGRIHKRGKSPTATFSQGEIIRRSRGGERSAVRVRRSAIKFKPDQMGDEGRVPLQSPSTRRANLSNAKRKPSARRGSTRKKASEGRVRTTVEAVQRKLERGEERNTKGKLLVTVDLGRLKAYRLDENRQFSRPRMELIEDWETNLSQHLSEEVTDQAGRFRKGTSGSEGPSALSDGEEHNLDLERRRRAMKALARRISELLDRERVNICYFAADSRIHQPILDEMQGRTRAKIQKNVRVNLSKLNSAEVLAHFL